MPDVVRGSQFTHPRFLEPTWKPSVEQTWTQDAPKARCVVTRVARGTVWFRYITSTSLRGVFTAPIDQVQEWVNGEGDRQLQEIYNKFDGSDGGANARLAWYGQCRAKEMSHDEAVRDTFEHFSWWCRQVWPKRKIQFPT